MHYFSSFSLVAPASLVKGDDPKSILSLFGPMFLSSSPFGITPPLRQHYKYFIITRMPHLQYSGILPSPEKDNFPLDRKIQTKNYSLPGNIYNTFFPKIHVVKSIQGYEITTLLTFLAVNTW